jgi:hypothetical protein
MGPFDGDFSYLCYLFFGSFLLVAGVVGVFILGELGIFGVGVFRRSVAGVGIFVDQWHGFSRRISTTSWTKIRS